MVLTVGSLFSGIGGLDLGLERAGMRVVWQSEVDPYATRVLAKHWPGVPNLGDIIKIDWSGVERPDLVCGGFPCQPVSQAGRQRAQADERWLWPEYTRCLRVLRPRHVIVENVPGLLVRGMGDVLGDLAALGYDAEWDCVPAAAVGAPHLRWRVFVVAHTDSPGSQGHGRPVEGAGEWPSPPRGATNRTGTVAHADSERLEERRLSEAAQGDRSHPARRDRLGVFTRQPRSSGWWEPEPDVGRVAHGIPSRVDRLRTLGNAVVPQVGEYVGRRLLEWLKRTA